ncbi:pilus assembly FimT family protein [Deinococcus ruber]|uniref:Prepilin-type N-terminal cleavage/methylation domain-containing protein n=1 Tax=Deinococcus ruber TaxID=1848197 RepID=A0A918F4D8_9DEIO|nr:prepilin-type N-terminal cleavage/methylation domain-containing protein [Deinococcus ruber]GGR07612.1 hypothetical protein GCM10008957_20380 [Deinococcus ruber]
MRYRQSGFTVLELLVVMAIIGILSAVAFIALTKRNNQLQNLQFIEKLGQDINYARSIAMAKGQKVQIQFNSLNGYTVTNIESSPQMTIATASNSQVALGNISLGDKIVCSSTGFCFGYTSANALKTISSITATTGTNTKTLSITLLGLTRIES